MAGSSSQQQIDFESLSNSQESVIAGDRNSTTDEKPIIIFNHLGQIISNKTKLLNRTLVLLKVQVGLEYDDWRIVPQAIKDEMWESIKREFTILHDRKEEVMKEMGVQLKTWRGNVRSKYLKDLNVAQILALKDNAAPKKKAHTHQWNVFIEHEATEKKLKQIAVYRANMAQKVDVHCLGRKSYADKTNEMVYIHVYNLNYKYLYLIFLLILWCL